MRSFLTTREFHSVALDATPRVLKTYPKSLRLNEAKTLLAEVLLTTKNYKEAVEKMFWGDDQ